jgi:hypothetical protein
MIGNKWFCEPDPFREKYCFFYSHTTLKGEKQRKKAILKKAYDILNGPLPESNKNCEYCGWVQNITKHNYSGGRQSE